RRTRVRGPLARIVAREESILGCVTIAGVHGITEVPIEREQEGAVVLLADAPGERPVFHEVRGARVITVNVHAHDLLARDGTMLEVTGVKLRVTPVAGPPVHHVTVVLIAREFGGLSKGVESGEWSDARLFHCRVAVVERLPEAALDVGAHLCGDARDCLGLAPEPRVR